VVKTWSTPVTAESGRLIPCPLCGGAQFKNALQCGAFAYVRCTRCGLVQMNPQPDEAQVMKRYQETSGADYCAYERANEESFLNLQLLALRDAGFYDLERELFEGANSGSQERIPAVLDVGCATGTLLSELKRRGWQTCGVEISPSAEYARSVRSLDVRGMPLEQNNFKDASFDVILASHFIEHLNDPRRFLQEAYRLLKTGGRLFITTPNISGFQSRIFGSAWRSAIFDHLYLFSVKTLCAMLINSGFELESVHTWGGLAAGTAPPWLKKIADHLAKKTGQGDVMILRAEKNPGG